MTVSRELVMTGWTPVAMMTRCPEPPAGFQSQEQVAARGLDISNPASGSVVEERSFSAMTV